MDDLEKEKYSWIDDILKSIGLCLVYRSSDPNDPRCKKHLWLFRIRDDHEDFDNAVIVHYSSDSSLNGRRLVFWTSYQDFLFEASRIITEFVYLGKNEHWNEIEIANPFFKKTVYEMKIMADLA